MSVILDYAVKFSEIDAYVEPSSAFLKKVAVICSKIVSGSESEIQQLFSMDDVIEFVPNEAEEIRGFFDGGLTSVFVVLVDKVEEVKNLINGKESDFFTVHNSSSFDNADFLKSVESWKGVVGFCDIDKDFCKENAKIKNTSSMYVELEIKNAYKSMYSFGKLLSSSFWRNQQYTSIKSKDGAITTVGESEELFDARVGFWMNDVEMGTKLCFFCAGGLSITSPYIFKDCLFQIQNAICEYITVNEPFNIIVERSAVNSEAQKIINDFLGLGYLDPEKDNFIKITKSAEVFVINGNLEVAPSVAMWRAKIDARQL